MSEATKQNINYEDHLGLVINTIEKTFKSIYNASVAAEQNGMELEDLIQGGNIALWKATQTFDESKGYTFATYASMCIRGGILNELNMNPLIKIPKDFVTKEEKYEIISSTISMQKQIGVEPDDTVESMLKDENEYEGEVISNVFVNNILSNLKERERIIVENRINGMPFKEIGAILDTSDKSCEFTYRRCIKKLRETLSKEDFVNV